MNINIEISFIFKSSLFWYWFQWFPLLQIFPYFCKHKNDFDLIWFDVILSTRPHITFFTISIKITNTESEDTLYQYKHVKKQKYTWLSGPLQTYPSTLMSVSGKKIQDSRFKIQEIQEYLLSINFISIQVKHNCKLYK